MKHFIITLFFCALTNSIFSQEIKETTLDSRIQEATLFLSGAQVFEQASGQISSGESIILLKGLSPFLEEKSLQVKGEGNFTIQAINKRLDFLSEKLVNEKVKELETQIEAIKKDQTLAQNRLQILANKSALLLANKDLSGNQTGPTMTELKAALDFFDLEFTKITNEELQIKSKIIEGDKTLDKLTNQIAAIRASENKSTSEIRIRIKSPQGGKATFYVNYLVANAGWYPKYDVRVKNIASPLQLNYKAEVFQNTGVDWNNVKLKFSNADPNQSGLAPVLEKWELNYARYTMVNKLKVPQMPGTVNGIVLDENGEPLPGAAILVTGSSIGTVSDMEGRYSLTIPSNGQTLSFSFVGYENQQIDIDGRSSINARMNPDVNQLQEMVVTGYDARAHKALAGKVSSVVIRGENSIQSAPLMTTFVENQTTVEIEVAEPYTIKTNGERTLVDLNTFEIPANYQYLSIPKIDPEAFLLARIPDWNQYNLLEGESNLYFEDGFVARSILSGEALEDTLAISMGRDKSLVIQREKVDQNSKKKTIGSNITETRGISISIRNNKSQTVSLQVKDQIPVAVNSSIEVIPGTLSGGTLDPKSGILSWEVSLSPGEIRKLEFQYEVKYPKSEKVILD